MSNNNIIDSSVNSHSVTVTGDVQQGTFSPYAAGGYSTRFHYEQDNWKATSTDFVMGADDFTVEMWIYPDGLTPVSSTINHTLFNFGDTDYNNVNDRIALSRSPETGRLRFHYGASSLNVITSELGWAVTEYSTWSHVAVTRESGTFKFWVDGALRRSVELAFNMTNDVLSIGYDGYYGSNRSFNGLISDVRVVKGTAVYTAAFTPPTEPLTLTDETVLLTCNKPYMSAVGNEYSPASVSTTEVFTDAESATMITGFTSIYPGLGANQNLRISPNGEHMFVGAEIWTNSGNRGRSFLLSTDDLGSIAYQSLEPTGYASVGYQNAFRNVAITDTHLAFNTGHTSEGGSLTGLSTKITNAVSNGTYPAGVFTGSSDWEFKPNYAFCSLDDLSTPTYLATPGQVSSGGAMSMHGNYIVLVESTTSTSAYSAGMWVYDITDTTLVASAGSSFAPVGSQQYIDVNQGAHLFPKYFIPPQTGNLQDYSVGVGISVAFSGDYIVRGAGEASSMQGRVEVFKMSDLKTIASGQTQASAHAVILGGSSSQASRFGRKLETDGTNILVAGFDISKAYINVYDMDGNSVADINVKDFNNNSGFIIDDMHLSSDYIMVGSKNFHGNSGISNAGGYALLDRSDPSVVLKEGHGESSNDYMGHSVAIAPDQTFIAHVSRLSSENGELNIESISATPAGYSSASHSLTLSGDVSTERSAPYSYVDYSAASHGGSAYFDGTGDELLIAASEDFNFGTGDFTIEMWVKPDSMTGNSSATVYGSESYRISVYPSTSAYQIQYQEYTNSTQLHYNLGHSINGMWVYIALVREGGTIKLFANGLEITPIIAGGSATANYDHSSTGIQSIGSANAKPNWNDYFTGHISDVRVVKGSAVYTADFTIPSAPLTAVTGTTLLLPFDDATIIDKSGSAVISVQGDVAVSDVAPPYVGGKSFTFDGTGDYVEAQDADISLSGDFTIEAWVKVSSASGNQQIVAFPGSSNDAGLLTSGGSFVFADGNTNLISAGTLVVDQWHHVAVSRSSETVTLFVDGASVGTSSGHTATVGTSGDVNVGSNTSNGNLLTGELADIRIVESAVYTDTFTPPTGSYWD